VQLIAQSMAHRQGYSLMTLALWYGFLWATFAFQTTLAHSRFGGKLSGVHHSAKIRPKEPKVTLSHRKIGKTTFQLPLNLSNSSAHILKWSNSSAHMLKWSRKVVMALSRHAIICAGAMAIDTLDTLVHETGHYVAAKCCGIRVGEVSIGTGTKLLGFRTKEGVHVNWRMEPGGYITLPYCHHPELEQFIERKDLDDCDEFLSRTKTTFATKLLSCLSLGLWDDKLWNDEKKRRRNSFYEMMEEILFKPLNADSIQGRPAYQQALVSGGGICFNFLLAYIIYFGQIIVGSGIPVMNVSDGITVYEDPVPGTPAHGLLCKGDVILKVDGLPATPNGLTQPHSENESRKAIVAFLSKIRATPDGGSLQLTVMGPVHNTLRVVTIHPKRRFQGWLPKAISPIVMGASLSPHYVKSSPIKSSNPIAAGRLAFQYLLTMTSKSAFGLFGLSGIGSPLIVGSTVAGVGGLMNYRHVSMQHLWHRVVATQNWTTVLMFAAVQSIATAVTNSFPTKCSDGGQVVLAMGEAITGRKLNQKFFSRIIQIAGWWTRIHCFVEPWDLFDFANAPPEREMGFVFVLIRPFVQPWIWDFWQSTRLGRKGAIYC
jgi:membrane-associated protease RseP (regulator of RpoE activity)